MTVPDAVRDELSRLNKHYELGDELDRGANGYVYFARNRITGKEFALKFYPVEADGTQHFEPLLLAQLDSPNVLEVYDARTVGDDWAFFATPKCDGGDLDDAISKGLSAHEALDIILGVCRGVTDIHAESLVHRDLKPQNIVLDGGVPKIADFGSVRLIPDGQTSVPASEHTIVYRTPESLGENGSHGKPGDVYQVGVVAYQLLGGTLSYKELDYLNAAVRRQLDKIADPIDRRLFVDGVIHKRIQSGRLLDFESLPPWAKPMVRVLRRMTAPDPAARFQSMSEAAVGVHATRPRIGNWKATKFGALLVERTRVVELRYVSATGTFQAFVDNGNGFRRAGAIAQGSLGDLVKQF